MRFLRKSATAALVGALAAGAHAGQIFSFQNPIANGSFNNAMFETTSLFPGNTNPLASVANLYAGNVTLDVTNFSAQGVQQGSTQHVAAKYYLSNLGTYSQNDLFSGNFTGSNYATGDGLLTFVDPGNVNSILLQITFTASSLTYGNLAAAGVIGFSGSLKTTGETGNENASFGFPNRYTASGSATDAVGHHTGSFTSSIGQVTPVPEPASLAALAMGGLVVLRRKRRA